MCLRLHEMIRNPIAVGDTDAGENSASNNLVTGDTVLPDTCTDNLRAKLAKAGYDARPCDMSEFKKSGRSLRFLVLSLVKNDATPGRSAS